jgi:phosphoenolpyruvate-protein phosphotransferase (PTS system enzyme I)
MSFESQDVVNNSLVFGDFLPSDVCQEACAPHLYVSLSELILDTVFYHPIAGENRSELSVADNSALQAIVGDQVIAEHFVDTLVTRIEAAIQPIHQTVRICLSDADSYQYKALIGGDLEAQEINPMLGVRGVSRLVSAHYQSGFALECEVIKLLLARGRSVDIVVPFVRALSDAAGIIDRLAERGLPRGINGLKVLYSCDVPSAVLLAERLLQYFDGVVINVTHLAELTLGVDRLNEQLSHLFTLDSEAVLALVDIAVKAARSAKKPVVIIAEQINQYPKLTEYLSDQAQAEAVFSL